MKPFFLLLCGVTAFVACDNATNKETAQTTNLNSDLLQQNLQGNVKSITETSTAIDSTGKEKADTISKYISFDQKGYQTEYVTKNNAGKVLTEQFAMRNDSGVVTEFGSKRNGKLISRVVTEIDKDGKYLGGKTYDSTGKQDGYYKDLAQNEYSIVYRGKQYDMNNKIKETFDMKYDKNHYLGGKSTDSTGKITYEGTAKVNDKGDMAEEEYTYLDGGISKSEKKTYKYDSYDKNGNWTQRTTYNDKGKPTSVAKRSIVYY